MKSSLINLKLLNSIFNHLCVKSGKYQSVYEIIPLLIRITLLKLFCFILLIYCIFSFSIDEIIDKQQQTSITVSINGITRNKENATLIAIFRFLSLLLYTYPPAIPI